MDRALDAVAGTITVEGPSRVRGEIRVPGDKSISHRAALLACAAAGRTVIEGYLPADDCLRTLTAARRLGAGVEIARGGARDAGAVRVVVDGVAGAFREPDDVIDVGNSGTLIRLLAGLLAGTPGVTVILSGDDSIRRRPMGRVVQPLKRMGACIVGRAGDTLAPLAISGRDLNGIAYEAPVASAQVKSAVLLAGLSARGTTTVAENMPTRDHTERMLGLFGVRVDRGAPERIPPARAGVVGPAALVAPSEPLVVPGDLSSAAPFLAACAASGDPGVTLCVKGIGVNPLRMGLLSVLRRMGARIAISSPRWAGEEPIGDLEVSPPEDGRLHGVEVPPSLIPAVIDEVPALALAASVASGETRVTGAIELRVKESDRISSICKELARFGARARALEDGLVIEGVERLSPAECFSHGDHRIAMMAVAAGSLAAGVSVVRGTECIATSFPGFVGVARQAGMRLRLGHERHVDAEQQDV